MKRRKSRYLELGEVSSATLRPEDLIPAYLSALEDVRLSREDRIQAATIARDSERDGYYDGEGENDPDEDTNALADILDAHCPPYTYFGSLEGDGACFGVWVAQESLDEDVREGVVWKTDGSEPASVGAVAKLWRYRLVVSDHGNMSLYYRNGREVWSVV